MQELLRVEHLVGKYQAENGEITAAKDISFTVEKGEFISIVGPSGCGKSTLLSMIAGLLKPTRGRIFIAGEEVCKTSDQVGYMLQKDNLLEWRTIYQNVVLGLELRHILTKEHTDYVDALLKTYGLWEFRSKYPSQLSGGMRQRAALIRTLATRPQLLLLDEAFSALDYQTRLAVTEDVYSILRREGKTMLMVTHDIPESISMADRVIVLTNRPATVRSIHEIKFDIPDRTPLSCRDHPQFQVYFNAIWKELEVHV